MQAILYNLVFGKVVANPVLHVCELMRLRFCSQFPPVAEKQHTTAREGSSDSTHVNYQMQIALNHTNCSNKPTLHISLK